MIDQPVYIYSVYFVIMTHLIGIYSFLWTIVGCKKQFKGLIAAMLYG